MTERPTSTGTASDLLKPAAAAELLMVSVRTLDRYQKNGLIQPRMTPGGHRRFRRVDVEQLLRPEASSSVPAGVGTDDECAPVAAGESIPPGFPAATGGDRS